MRRPLLLAAVAGLSVLATGCFSSGAGTGTTGLVPHGAYRGAVVHNIAAAATVAQPSRSQLAAAAVNAALKHTLAAGSAVVTEVLSFPNMKPAKGIDSSTVLSLDGALDFTNDRGHFDMYLTPETDKTQLARVVRSHGKDYVYVADALVGVVSEAKTDSFKSELSRDVTSRLGAVTDDGGHNLLDNGVVREYSFRLNVAKLLSAADPKAASNPAAQALANWPATQDVYVDGAGRIAALVDTVHVLDSSVPANQRVVRLVVRFSEFGLKVYQHVPSATSCTCSVSV